MEQNKSLITSMPVLMVMALPKDFQFVLEPMRPCMMMRGDWLLLMESGGECRVYVIGTPAHLQQQNHYRRQPVNLSVR